MKKLILALCGILTLAILPAANADPITLTFDRTSSGTSYTENGMTIAATSAELVRTGMGYNYGNSSSWWLDCCDRAPETFSMTTGGFFNLLSILVYHSDSGDPIVWRGYRGGTLVATSTINQTIYDRSGFLFNLVGFTGLDLVTMSVVGRYTDPSFDNLTYEYDSVLEPSTLALLGIGLLGLGLARRRTSV